MGREVHLFFFYNTFVPSLSRLSSCSANFSNKKPFSILVWSLHILFVDFRSRIDLIGETFGSKWLFLKSAMLSDIILNKNSSFLHNL